MKKTIITLLALAGIAAAADVTWTGAAGDGTWNNSDNWSGLREGSSVPVAGDRIVIDNGDSVSSDSYDYASGTASKWTNANTAIVVKNGSSLTLGKPTTWRGDRYDANFTIEELCSVSVAKTFLGANNSIYGTLYIGGELSPGADTTSIDFGKSGSIQFLDGSNNRMEGNNRTLTLSAVLDTGVNGAGATYTLETRYLIMGDSDGDFNPGAYQALTLAGGTMTGTNGLTLTSAREGNVTLHAWVAAPTEQDPDAGGYTGAIYTNDSLEATAANYGKYMLGADKNGIYVQYVKADIVPEPTTATLSLLALAGLAARRRRASR